MDSRHQPPVPRREPKKGIRPELLFMLALMSLIGFLILKEEVPQVESWYLRVVDKEKWLAGENCRRAAIGAAVNSDFARVVDNGTVHPTENGYYVEGVIVGEMGETGAEVRFEFSCYTHRDGSIVKSQRTNPAVAPGRTTPPPQRE